MMLPDDVIRQQLLLYLSVYDIVQLDNACMNHKYRPQILDKMNGVILKGDKDKSMKTLLFKWLGIRRIYLINIDIGCRILQQEYLSMIQENYIDQFKYIKNINLRGFITDMMAIFIISRCPNLQSIYCIELSNNTNISVIAEYCPGLRSLFFNRCHSIDDNGLIAISKHCPKLSSLNVENCKKLTDASIISLSTHCTGLISINLFGCNKITDASVISISNHCPALQSLLACSCSRLTDASLISLSTHCTGLKVLDVWGCTNLTDASIISISTHCLLLQELVIEFCHLLSDQSLIAIASNWNVLQSLHTSNCLGIHKSLCHSFKSSSELQLALQSIYPTLL